MVSAAYYFASPIVNIDWPGVNLFCLESVITLDYTAPPYAASAAGYKITSQRGNV